MVFHTDHEIYDALPIPNDALDKGGVEMLRAGVVDEELFVTARRAFADPAPWGCVLADITRRLATLYAAEGDFTEANVSAAIARAFEESLSVSGATRKPTKRPTAKSARPRAKARAASKSTTKAVTRRQGARAKP
jgi:hypothetical protein